MTYWDTMADHLSDARVAIAAKKKAAEERPTVRLAFRFLQGFLFFLFVTGAFARLMMAVSAERFHYESWLNLVAWVCAGALYFGYWRPWR